MMRFFGLMYPNIPIKGSNIWKHPECLTFFNGKLVSGGIPIRNYVEKGDKHHHKGHRAREEKEHVQMPGFVHPDTLNEEGYFTQKAKQQIEEFKKKKDKPSLHNQEGRE